MNKKGLTMETIVIAILCLVVLAIMIFIFRSQVGSLMGGYTNIAKNATGQSCGVPWSGFQCFSKTEGCPKTGGWVQSNLQGCSSEQVCCESK